MKGVAVFLLANVFCSKGVFGELDSSDVAQSCVGLPDGETLIKWVNDESSPLLSVQCSNDYAIIDVNRDDDWESYLSSIRSYYYSVIGPSADDHVNWQEWLTFTSEVDSISDDWEFLVSPSCDTCDDTSDMQYYDSTSAYYMASQGTDCIRPIVSQLACDVKKDTYECQTCYKDDDSGTITSYSVYNGLNKETAQINQDDMSIESWVEDLHFGIGTCPYLVYTADATVLQADELSSCTINKGYFTDKFKPSLGTDGRFCVCVKPSDIEMTTYVEVSNAEIEKKMTPDEISESELRDSSESSTSSYYYLKQSDFEDGTYRILKEGTYIIMEDITFDFKAPTDLTQPSKDATTAQYFYNGDADAWWPTEADSDRFEGAGSISGGPYWMGFPYGITIECADVILDLNGHTLQMSTAFYYQQSFFANIGLVSQPFLPWQGFGPFGANPSFASNVIIKNGNLGLTSHWGIQGHYNSDITISNMKIYDFVTHGIQLAGFNSITITDVDIGSNGVDMKLSPYYAQMRHLLPMYRKQSEDELQSDVCVSLTNRDECVTMSDLVEDLTTILDMCFEYAVYAKDWDSIYDTLDTHTQQLWSQNKNAFIVENGYPQTAALYGMFLNYPGANVLGWYTNNDRSSDVILQNVYIHDLYHKSKEALNFYVNGIVVNSLNAPINMEHIYGDYDTLENLYQKLISDDGISSEDVAYNGNIIVDIMVVAYELVNTYELSWCYEPGTNAIFDFVRKLAMYGETEVIESSELFGCGQDAMVHTGKGVFGLRINGVDNVRIDNLRIENVISETDLGSEWCGDYLDDSSRIPTHQMPYLHTYQLNAATGVSITHSTLTSANEIAIDNVDSATGMAFGISLWFSASSINQIGSQLSVSNVKAGSSLTDDGSYSYDVGPNISPEACAIRVYDINHGGSDVITIENTKKSQFWKIDSISGFVGCGGSDTVYTSIGGNNHMSTQLNPSKEEIDSIKTHIRADTSSVHTTWFWYFVALFVACALLFVLSSVVTKYFSTNEKATQMKNELLLRSSPSYNTI